MLPYLDTTKVGEWRQQNSLRERRSHGQWNFQLDDKPAAESYHKAARVYRLLGQQAVGTAGLVDWRWDAGTATNSLHDDAVELSFDSLLCLVESRWWFGVLQWASEQTVNCELVYESSIYYIKSNIVLHHRNIPKAFGSCSTKVVSSSCEATSTRLWCGTKSRGNHNRTGCSFITFASGKFYGSTV